MNIKNQKKVPKVKKKKDVLKAENEPSIVKGTWYAKHHSCLSSTYVMPEFNFSLSLQTKAHTELW